MTKRREEEWLSARTMLYDLMTDARTKGPMRLDFTHEATGDRFIMDLRYVGPDCERMPSQPAGPRPARQAAHADEAKGKKNQRPSLSARSRRGG